MAGALMTFTYVRVPEGPFTKVIADWTSDSATGAVTGTTGNVICGELVKSITDPGAAAPTDDYDITITDEEGANVLTPCQLTLADRDTATIEQRYHLILDAAGTPLAQARHPVVCDRLTIAIANAGNSKTGQLVLFIKGVAHGNE